ncbi:CAP domain-containing protein [Phenylobacterium sp.]|jgi:Ca2+-binding RTX toxin-like protein|uniref:CAP domain-containing protein n=1 Tax=Phenylobacterium sp. TaxID=1871053 RepID=UPI002E2F6D7F|nr:CAP domain-containing protein [Phenylobacterium sp.]HEX2561451.1 CAP domain-containing protein [Phenylobacterium sp.]
MSQPDAFEQYMLELINAERAKAGAQPLAFDFDLNESAELHSRWMIDSDTFSHTGANGSTATQRMQTAGYQLTGSWSTGENIGWASLRGDPGYKDEVELLHANLMNSSGHRANILNVNFREIGVGFEVGEYQGWQGAFVTQNFAKSGTSAFLTGVAFDDQDGDRFYDPGEGLAGLTVTATSLSGAKYVGATYDSGGYDLALPAGTYSVSFTGAYTAPAQTVTIGSSNVKLDLIDPTVGSGTVTPPPPQAQPIVGTSSGEALTGTAGADTLQGLGGSDRLRGEAGADKLEGGTGNDTLHGGSGADLLLGGSGYDRFVFDAPLAAAEVDQIADFSSVYDTIQLENAVFTALNSTGQLASSAFWKGTGAHDATDRIIYNSATGEVIYDPDGTGAAPGQVFAKLATGLSVSYADFVVT